MKRSNPISDILKAKRWTAERAAQEIYKKNKKEFQLRGIVWTPVVFNQVKLGYCETEWLRGIVAKFFGIEEIDIPRRNKFSKRAREESGDPLLMGRKARKVN